MARQERFSQPTRARLIVKQEASDRVHDALCAFVLDHGGKIISGPFVYDEASSAYAVELPCAVLDRINRLVSSEASIWKLVRRVEYFYPPVRLCDLPPGSGEHAARKTIRITLRGYRLGAPTFEDVMRWYARNGLNAVRETSLIEPDGFVLATHMLEIPVGKLSGLRRLIEENAFFPDLDPQLRVLRPEMASRNEHDRWYLRVEGWHSSAGLKQSLLDELGGVVRQVASSIAELYAVSDKEIGPWRGDIVFEWTGDTAQPDPDLIARLKERWESRHGVKVEMYIGRWQPLDPPPSSRDPREVRV